MCRARREQLRYRFVLFLRPSTYGNGLTAVGGHKKIQTKNIFLGHFFLLCSHFALLLTKMAYGRNGFIFVFLEVP